MTAAMVLKLDSSFKPIEIIDWKEAFLLTWLNKAYAVEYSNNWVRSATERFQIPSVIVLFKYIDEKYFTIPCTSKNVMVRDNNMCQYCGSAGQNGELNIDHIIPRSKGGETEWENVVASCLPCNQAKKDLFLHQTGLKLLKKPVKPTYHSLMKKKVGNKNSLWSRYL